MSEVIDYTTHSVAQVTTDGAMSPAQRRAATRSVPQRQPAATPARADNRSEIRIMQSQIEGLMDKVARLETGYGHLLNELHPNGIPFDGSRTT